VDHVGPDDVEPLAQSSFPLCMQALQEALKANHHLRHGGRMQYGLFLKGVGLSLEDALVFWQREFTRNMTAEEFIKKVRQHALGTRTIIHVAVVSVCPQFALRALTLAPPPCPISWRASHPLRPQYAYNIRHNYGKEGKRADYTPYSCTRIIMATPPGSGEFHGASLVRARRACVRCSARPFVCPSAGWCSARPSARTC
jgi:DNA primase large subunit